jgi:TldD protein
MNKKLMTGQMTLARRSFLHYCATASAPLIAPHWLGIRQHVQHPQRAAIAPASPPWKREVLEELPDLAAMLGLAHHAIEASQAAGAAYTDVRLTQTLTESYTAGSAIKLATAPSDFPTRGFVNEDGRHGSLGFGGVPFSGTELTDSPSGVSGIPTLVVGIGVRAFAQGYWGFASSPYWTTDEAAWLGQEAARQAIQNARAGAPRLADLGPIPIVHQGQWVQPGIDPFTIPISEKMDFLRTMVELVAQYRPSAGASLALGVALSLALWREVRVFASSEGASYSQIRYRCFPGELQVSNDEVNQGNTTQVPDPFQARGWEALQDLKLDTLIPNLFEETSHSRDLSGLKTKPVEIGKYDVVFGASATAGLVYSTLGVATELDRALGYEANAAGTSYLGPDPLRYLGTRVAASEVTVLADRTIPHALATAQWDDEGVVCQQFPLITDGVLMDYQTTREQAEWLAPWYTKRSMSMQSRGCTVAETALDCPIQQSPNFVLVPSKGTLTVEELIQDTTHGVYFPDGWLSMDQQVKNGVFHAAAWDPQLLPREIRNGKLGPILTHAAVLFNSNELWKNVIALGGADSVKTTIRGESKGQPPQSSQCNVTAVPMKVRACSLIDDTRIV